MRSYELTVEMITGSKYVCKIDESELNRFMSAHRGCTANRVTRAFNLPNDHSDTGFQVVLDDITAFKYTPVIEPTTMPEIAPGSIWQHKRSDDRVKVFLSNGCVMIVNVNSLGEEFGCTYYLRFSEFFDRFEPAGDITVGSHWTSFDEKHRVVVDDYYNEGVTFTRLLGHSGYYTRGVTKTFSREAFKLTYRPVRKERKSKIINSPEPAVGQVWRHKGLTHSVVIDRAELIVTFTRLYLCNGDYVRAETRTLSSRDFKEQYPMLDPLMRVPR